MTELLGIKEKQFYDSEVKRSALESKIDFMTRMNHACAKICAAISTISGTSKLQTGSFWICLLAIQSQRSRRTKRGIPPRRSAPLQNSAPCPIQAAACRRSLYCRIRRAAIAEKLGRDQAFPGVAMRITGADYVVSFLIREARTGAIILTRTSELRLRADYSWDRGARALIKG